MKENEIRLNWRKALEEGKVKGSSIGWAFSQQDLFVLCCLHEANVCRQQIEDLLEDCNFHSENGLLYEGKYDECRKFIAEND